MGLLCCCLCGPTDELNCSCFRDCVQGIMDKYRSIFDRRRVSASDHEAVPLHSEMVHNGLTAPRHSDQTLPVDPNPQYSQVSRNDHVVDGLDMGSSRLFIPPEPFSRAVQLPGKACKMEDKLGNAYMHVESKEHCSVSSLKKTLYGVEYINPSSEDRDECPTCLEEYTEENPKITTICSHHFHLGCIYEWMERSDTCPVCGKLMQFNE